MPQSSSNRLPAASTRYFDPVTVPAAPRKVSFAIGSHCTRGAGIPVDGVSPRRQKQNGAGTKSGPPYTVGKRMNVGVFLPTVLNSFARTTDGHGYTPQPDGRGAYTSNIYLRYDR